MLLGGGALVLPPGAVRLLSITTSGATVLLLFLLLERKDRSSVRSAPDEASEPVFVTDGEGCVTRWSPEAEAFFGWTGREMKGRDVAEIAVPGLSSGADTMDLSEILRDAREGNRAEGGFAVRSRCGVTFPARVTASPTQGSERSGTAHGVEWRLRERPEDRPPPRELLETFARSSGDGIVALDHDLRITIWNPAMEKISGMDAADVLGRISYEVFPFMEDQGLTKELRRTLDGDELWLRSVPFSTSAGRSGYFDGRYCPLRSASGDVVGILGVVRDVTRQRESEAAIRSSERRYRELVEHAPLGVFRMAPDGRFTMVNETLAVLLGYESTETLIDLPLDRLYVRSEDRETLLERCRLLGRVVDFRVLWRQKSGQVAWIRIDLHASRNPDGTVRHFQGFAGDVTQRREIEDELRKGKVLHRALSRRLLEVQEQERGRIARELHDQIGQILTALRTRLEVVALDLPSDSERSRQHLRSAISTVDEGIEKVRTLSFELRPSMLDDLGLEAALRAYARRQASSAGLDLSLQVDRLHERVSSEVETACFRIGQEAVTNVIRHAEADRLVLRLAADGSRLVLTVEDDGVGIGPTDGEAKDDHDLGILGMRERAEFVGGTLQIVSDASEGTRVQATFPLSGDSGEDRG